VLNFIYYPVSAILWFWHKVFGAIPFLGPNSGIAWALSVIFLVFTLRALLFKPFVSQVRSMRKMQEFAPQIKKLQEKYKGDRQKLTAEMQKLQSEHGVNPLGGCLPILVQIPVFIGLFQVLREFKPGKNENYIFNKPEVASFIDADLFGAKLSAFIRMPAHELAALGTDRPHVIAVAIPFMIAASIATHITARHSVERQSAAAAANPQAAIMNKLMLWIFPLGVLVGGIFFPIAILIYWLANNGWTLGQQWVVYRKIDREETEKKEAAAAQRQSLAPRPGQKPVQKGKRGADAQPSEASTASDSVTDSDTPKAPDAPGATSTASDARPADSPAAGRSADGRGDTAGREVQDAKDVPSVAASGQPPKASDNGSQPQQRRQPQRVPQKKGRKRR
jgi:YidC/Oxa1 family membrane protein insertase